MEFKLRIPEGVLLPVLRASCDLFASPSLHHEKPATTIDANTPPLLLDAAAVSRAVMNLLVNALEALPAEGGKITLGVRDEAPAGIVLRQGYDFRVGQGRCALIEVTDTGSGIPPSLLARVSEPFFSTKARGSGFGLATVLGTVRAHRGLFHVESVPDKGSRFCIWLPFVDAT